MAFPTDQTVSFTGQQNLTGDKRALFQTLFAGEVLTEFHKKNIFMPLHRVKTLKGARSYSFPMVGTFGGAGYHTPGQLIEGSTLAHAKRTITVDDLLIAPVFIDRLDEALLEYDARSIYTKECGKSLSDIADRNIARKAVQAALITNSTQATAAGLTAVTGETFTPNVTLGAVGDELKGQKIYEAILKTLQNYDEAGIDHTDAVVILPPAQYYTLLNSSSADAMVWANKDVGGTGVIGSKVPTIGGKPVYMSNHLPQTNQSAGSTDPEPLSGHSGRTATYRGDYSKVVGLVMLKDAVATVKVFDLATESEYQINRQGWLFVAKYAMGTNILRPACAQVILKA